MNPNGKALLKENKRYYLLDSLRGISTVSMVAFHLCYDIFMMYGLNTSWYFYPMTAVWERSICVMFILLSGMCLNFSGNGINVIILFSESSSGQKAPLQRHPQAIRKKVFLNRRKRVDKGGSGIVYLFRRSTEKRNYQQSGSGFSPVINIPTPSFTPESGPFRREPQFYQQFLKTFFNNVLRLPLATAA